MPPDSFERLARRLLREAGFVSATVTGKSGDGGIDGIGVYRLSLVSFPVFFQCKRYRGSVGAAPCRDFRGAMSGRGDKGLLITTGWLHRRCQARGDARWRSARRPHRRRAAMRSAQGTQDGRLSSDWSRTSRCLRTSSPICDGDMRPNGWGTIWGTNWRNPEALRSSKPQQTRALSPEQHPIPLARGRAVAGSNPVSPIFRICSTKVYLEGLRSTAPSIYWGGASYCALGVARRVIIAPMASTTGGLQARDSGGRGSLSPSQRLRPSRRIQFCASVSSASQRSPPRPGS